MLETGEIAKEMPKERKVQIGTSKFTKVISVDEKEFYAFHKYEIRKVETDEVLTSVNFQKGPIKENGINGVHHEDLIAIVIDRLLAFQDCHYRCKENEEAITKLEEALMWLRKRTQDRENRGVEGTSKI